MKKENLVGIFLRKHRGLLLCLSLFLLLPVAVLLWVFTGGFRSVERIGDFSAWASLVAGIMTYVSAALLGLAVYYHTWSGQYREEKLFYSVDLVPIYRGEIRNFFDIEDFDSEERQFFYEYTEDEYGTERRDYAFKRIVIKNFNPRYPQSVEIVRAELSIDGADPVDCIDRLMVVTNFEMSESAEDRRPRILLIGIDELLLEKWREPGEIHTHTLRLLLRVSNACHTEYVEVSSEKNDATVGVRVLTRQEEQAVVVSAPCISRVWTKENRM